ncbi:MAG: mandelate racemase/muconate lactonizing enzyme family protein, partial [Planctomycetota bacterium]
MKIAEIRLQRYDLELVKPITVKGHALEKRSGLILSVIDSAYGEVSPLPFLHAETIDEAVLCISQIRQTVVGMDVQDDTISVSDPIEKTIGINLPPSVIFGIETALFDLYLQQADCRSLSELKVPVCGLTSTASKDLHADLRQMLEQGYSAVKIKVGANSIAEDAERIEAAKEILRDNMGLRLDANRAWSLQDAIAFCERIGSERIEYIEEPVNDTSGQKAFADSTDIPLALD